MPEKQSPPPSGSKEDGQVPTSSASPSSPQQEAPSSAHLPVQIEEAEQGSVTATLTGPRTLTQSPSFRRNAESAESTLVVVKPLKSSRGLRRPSRLSKFVFKLVPCVASKRAHPTDGLDPSSSTKLDQTSSVQMKEISKADSSSQTLKDSSPTSSTTSAPPGTSDRAVPQTVEMDVIVPPPPNTHLLPTSETDGVTSGAVQPPGSTGEPMVRVQTRDSSDDSDGTSFTDDECDDGNTVEVEDDEARLIKNGGAGIPLGPDGVPRPLLPPIAPHHTGRKCLVLDLDETLVHSSFKAVQQADFIVPVEIEYHWHHFHVLKRPGVDNFLKKMGEIYEVVVYTASLSKYADPVLDKLDVHNAVTHRLFRESCYSHKGNYVKDLSQLGRPIADTIILDNSPASYIFHPNNAVPVSSWFNDPHDTELVDLVPFLADLTQVGDRDTHLALCYIFRCACA